MIKRHFKTEGTFWDSAKFIARISTLLKKRRNCNKIGRHGRWTWLIGDWIFRQCFMWLGKKRSFDGLYLCLFSRILHFVLQLCYAKTTIIGLLFGSFSFFSSWRWNIFIAKPTISMKATVQSASMMLLLSLKLQPWPKWFWREFTLQGEVSH